jgi:uncharacterized protein YecT (DUF1311 family)
VSGLGGIGRSAVALVALLAFPFVLSHEAQAEDCDSPRLNTYQHSECEMRNEQAARARMQSSLDRAVRAAEALRTVRTVDFVPEIQRTQQLWAQWSDAECELESGAIMGSAEAFEIHICRRKQDEIRQRSLDDLSSQFEDLAR